MNVHYPQPGIDLVRSYISLFKDWGSFGKPFAKMSIYSTFLSVVNRCDFGQDSVYISGCKVVKPAGGELIGVKGNPNAEPRMWIITATEGDLVRQTKTTSSVKARDAAAKKRARETEAEGAESSQADGGEFSRATREHPRKVRTYDHCDIRPCHVTAIVTISSSC
jgi:hypothetical protein